MYILYSTYITKNNLLWTLDVEVFELDKVLSKNKNCEYIILLCLNINNIHNINDDKTLIPKNV